MSVINYPRFRYILITPTVERGSQIRDFNISRDYGFEEVKVAPVRRVEKMELLPLKKGIEIWQKDILNRGSAEVEILPENTIKYKVAFNSHEQYTTCTNDESFLEMLNLERSVYIKKALMFLENSTNVILEDGNSEYTEIKREWEEILAIIFAYSIPHLLVDELVLRSFERTLFNSIISKSKISKILSVVYRSFYVEDIINKTSLLLPSSKEWVDNPKEFSVPIYHGFDRYELFSELEESCVKILDKKVYDHLKKQIQLAGQMFRLSEETHYIVGTMLLAGNHIWLNELNKTQL